MDFYADLDWEEVFEYQPGFIIELKADPGVFDAIASYDPMIVPPICLKNDPRPRYPHELRVVLRSMSNLISPLQCKLVDQENQILLLR